MKSLSTIFLGLLLATQAVGAADLPRSGCGTIPLAYYENGALYYRNADGRYAGIDKDVVEEVARRTGCQIKLPPAKPEVYCWSASKALVNRDPPKGGYSPNFI
jgi:ABC-type amino acid transport substrate-binding protein